MATTNHPALSRKSASADKRRPRADRAEGRAEALGDAPGTLFNLVGTRLRPPVRVQGTVDRRRLSELIEEVSRLPLTVVNAPAGYGKSSVLGQWHSLLVARQKAVGWVSLDNAADDLGSFFRYVVGSIRCSRPDFAPRLAFLLESVQRSSVTGITAAFTNSVLDVKEDVFLFLWALAISCDGS